MNAEWDSLYASINSGQFKFSPEAFESTFQSIRRTMTLTVLTVFGGDLLDNESHSDEQSPNTSIDVDIEFEPSDSTPFGDIGVKVLPSVGRATVYRKRSSYGFQASDDPDARQRSSEANFRRAIRRAADQALSQDLGIFVTLTFADHCLDLNPLGEVERFNRRLRDHGLQQDRHAHYVEVVTNHSGRPHCHGVLSRWLDFETIANCWPNGHVEITELHPDDIEGRVRYMGGNAKHHRFHSHVLLQSKGDRPQEITATTKSFDSGKQAVSEIIHPQQPRVRSNRPFGKRGSVIYTFDRIQKIDEV